jgi:phosphoribosyl-AMP cyclohydrolase / phosphoribosyl-ATP pyrophosphohydrolase
VSPALTLPEDLVFDERGLLPVVVQDRASGDVLMLAWANAEALRLTAETGLAHFWSRSRRASWKKGESSGNVLRVREARIDCDRDTLVLVVDPDGPACHTGARTCFGETSGSDASLLAELERVIASRAGADPATSYTARLLAKGLDQALKKVGEESTELVMAAKAESAERLAGESADLLFHLLVVLHQRGVSVADVLQVLRQRRAGGR